MSSAASAAFKIFCSTKGVPLGSPVADRIRLSVFDNFDQLDGYTVYSVGPKIKGKEMGDDHAFLTTPGLLEVLPRGGAILVKDEDGTIVKFLGGPAKFFGVQVHDDDDIGDATAGAAGAAGAASVEALVQAVTGKTDTDIQTIFEWAQQGVLHTTKTNKENGKFANVTLYWDKDRDVIYILFGSKGCHMVTTFDRIDATLAALRRSNSALMAGILGDIQRIYPALLVGLKGEFEAGWSAAAEFCDEAHLCPASDDTRNRLVFFGLFDTHGVTMRTKVSDELFRAAGLLTVQKEVVPVEQLHTVLHTSDLEPFVEGSVLYFENTTSGQTVVLKKKSAWYIFLRGLREIIKRGYTYKLESRVKNWLVDKCGGGYLKFSTAAAQRAVRVAYAFAGWMRDNNIPVGALGHMPVKGLAVHGFIPFWRQYLATAGSLDLLLEAGPFSTQEFLAPNPELSQYNLGDHHHHGAHVTVLFWQGVPGLGKTTLAEHLVAKIKDIEELDEGGLLEGLDASIIEQDRCGGCSATTLIALSHAILKPGKPGKRRLIIVSRNNGNPSQYNHYLQVCHELNTRVFFLAPDKMDPLVLAACLAGCLERTCPTDPELFMMGDTPMSALAIVECVTDVHYKKFTFHPQALRYAPFTFDFFDFLSLAKEAGRALGAGKDSLLAFVTHHRDTLRQMRVSGDTIFASTLKNHLATILCATAAAARLLPDAAQVAYVGGMVASGDRDILRKVLQTHIGSAAGSGGGEIVNHHLTLYFHGRKDKVPLPPNLPLPGDNLPFLCHISGLVIFHFHDEKLGKAAAWVLKRTAPEDPLYHITALVPPHKKAQFSSNFIHLPHGTTTGEGRVQVIMVNGEIPPFPLVCQWMTQ